MATPTLTSRPRGNFRVGEWLVEPIRNQISGPGVTTRLEPRVMTLLVCLAERAPDILSRDALTEELWQDTFVTDEVLTQSVSELRKALGDDPKEPRFVLTVPKQGYQLIAPVEREPPDEESLPPPPAEPATGAVTESRSRERIAWAILTVLLLLALFHFARAPALLEAVRFGVQAPTDTYTDTLEISPDGTRLAFMVTHPEGGLQIWTHEIETGRRQALPGTEGAWHLFWSPDGRSIGFSTMRR